MKVYKLSYSVNGNHCPWTHVLFKRFWFCKNPKDTMLDEVKQFWGDGYEIKAYIFRPLGFWEGLLF